MKAIRTIKDFFAGKKKKPLTKEQMKASPTSLRTGIQTIRERQKRQKAQLDKIMNN